MFDKYGKIPVSVLMDTVNSDDILSLFRKGIDAENSILAISAFEALIKRGYYNELIEIILDALSSGRINNCSTFSITLSNYLVSETEPHQTELKRLGDVIETSKDGFEAAEKYIEQHRRANKRNYSDR